MENATIIERIAITDELVIIKVKPDAGVPSFQSGQYVALGLPGIAPRPAHFPSEPEEAKPDKLIKRAYSVGSSPEEKEFLEFYIAIVPTGALTPRLLHVDVGARVFAAAKIIGTFTLAEVPPENNLVLIATGTGLAPFISMIRTPTTWTEGRTVTILHGVRHENDLAYREEIESYIKEGKNLKYHPVVSRDFPTGREFRQGYVQDLLIDETVPLNPVRDNVFVCGNPAMIKAIEELLIPNGYTEHSKKNPGNLHVEKYW